jgi:hypothetical protein
VFADNADHVLVALIDGTIKESDDGGRTGPTSSHRRPETAAIMIRPRRLRSPKAERTLKRSTSCDAPAK